MATKLAIAHIQAQARLRAIVAQALGALWLQTGHYDQADVDPFLARALPIVLGGQKQSSALTAAFLARSLRIPSIAINPTRVTGAALRNGVAPEVVYTRPFINVWTALKDGKPYEDAVASGQARLESTGQMDIAMASRETFDVAQQDTPGIYGYQRVADGGACEFCQSINGAYVKSASASPLHNNCGCGLEPLTSEHPDAKYLPDGSHITDTYAIHTHGELGAVITNPNDTFTSEADF